eukprot:81641-Chlamydomonas_euryale.AAC.24
MNEDRLPCQVFDCSLARSVGTDGRMEQLKSRQGHRNMEDFLDVQLCNLGSHEEGSGGGTTFLGLSQVEWLH